MKTIILLMILLNNSGVLDVDKDIEIRNSTEVICITADKQKVVYEVVK